MTHILPKSTNESRSASQLEIVRRQLYGDTVWVWSCLCLTKRFFFKFNNKFWPRYVIIQPNIYACVLIHLKYCCYSRYIIVKVFLNFTLFMEYQVSSRLGMRSCYNLSEINKHSYDLPFKVFVFESGNYGGFNNNRCWCCQPAFTSNDTVFSLSRFLMSDCT